MQTILVTGAKGQLGSELQQLASSYPKFEFIFTDKEELSIVDETAINSFFDMHQFAFCINCAAYTAVDKSETDADAAYAVNANAAGFLAAACKKHNTRFVQVSTDYVFDGTSTVPYKESDPTNPLGVYGASKLKGEQLATEKDPSVIILRTSWVYSSFGANFVKTMLRLMNERESINVVNDQLGSPTFAADLAKAILDICQWSIDNKQWPAGIYNYSNEGIISWYDFAVAIKELSNSKCQVNPIPSSAYPTPAKRPAYSAFDKEKIKSTFRLHIPEWKDSLHACLLQIMKYIA
ncbi:dTDP-4-dehydrorhamnose reductase [Pinibacter aurantiacus]|uniref:dTDP-4-dehydrorhamnose reductase n=1 Tax=Pinibacter aurantiacus TaxID=2851599 RepID=A0A9E2S8M3_9BACT|nr:dTDP-4-dehydrorhamnose reductase [Pinibacter aurantiacus]MBV4358341.1 dTDP-4-dehydrorhamnose reductase [Pinibacter aurantiacus]